MRATGNVKKLIIGLGQIQDLVGEALTGYQDDRTECRASRVVPPLQKVEKLCIRLRSLYDPIEESS